MPNSDVSNGKITNYSTEEKGDSTTLPSHTTSSEKVRGVVEYISSHPKVDKDPAPMVAVSNYKDSAIEYVVRAGRQQCILGRILGHIQWYGCFIQGKRSCNDLPAPQRSHRKIDTGP